MSWRPLGKESMPSWGKATTWMSMVSRSSSMHSYNNAYVVKLMRLLKLSEINFVANPLVNTHLQGRMEPASSRS